MNKQAFDEAVVKSKTLKEKPSNDILLQLYSLYKQATEGDVSGERPGGFDFKGAAKYDAWAAQKGKNQDVASEEYIQLVNKLISVHP
ncbi:MAG: acyl-CoA-binding protein [Bacteroidales bacterium]|nr:acyl-CoA-binding protein [Bacteroidales bacterium]